jgi:predicted ATPase
VRCSTGLVIDNCEHVIDACARLAASLPTSCAGLRILATSRESLGVSGETVWRLEPLEAEDAQRLFTERARQRRPQFVPDSGAAETIGVLCERLDRLPLAIELAAARIGAMSPAEILSDLEARLATLGGGPRLAPARHRTVRATVEWSYELLDGSEPQALRSLAVFVAGFDAEAAIAVAPGLTPDLLARLVDKSVVAAGQSPRGRTRYRLLETVREYARERLVAAGEVEAAGERHLQHYLSALAGDTEPVWPAYASPALLDERREDYENIRAALEWAAVRSVRRAAPARGLARPLPGARTGGRPADRATAARALPLARPLPGRGPDPCRAPGDADGERARLARVPQRGAAAERRAGRDRA